MFRTWCTCGKRSHTHTPLITNRQRAVIQFDNLGADHCSCEHRVDVHGGGDRQPEPVVADGQRVCEEQQVAARKLSLQDQTVFNPHPL